MIKVSDFSNDDIRESFCPNYFSSSQLWILITFPGREIFRNLSQHDKMFFFCVLKWMMRSRRIIILPYRLLLIVRVLLDNFLCFSWIRHSAWIRIDIKQRRIAWDILIFDEMCLLPSCLDLVQQREGKKCPQKNLYKWKKNVELKVISLSISIFHSVRLETLVVFVTNFQFAYFTTFMNFEWLINRKFE